MTGNVIERGEWADGLDLSEGAALVREREREPPAEEPTRAQSGRDFDRRVNEVDAQRRSTKCEPGRGACQSAAKGRLIIIKYSLPEETGPVAVDKGVVGCCRLPVTHSVDEDGCLHAEGSVGVVDNLFVLQAAYESEVGDVRDVGRAAGDVDEAAVDGVSGGIEASGGLNGNDDELASAGTNAESRGEDDC